MAEGMTLGRYLRTNVFGSHVYRWALARRPLQPFWQRLHALSLIGMNVGGGCSVRDSGEVWALRHVRTALQRAGVRQPVVFDVGANRGDYLRHTLEIFGRDAEIHAFEPSPSTFRGLRHEFGAMPNVRLVNLGLSDHAQCLPLYRDAAGSPLASLHRPNLDHQGLALREMEEVSLMRLDDYCEGEGIDRVHFLKLDVEGHEAHALRGAERMLQAGAIDFIQFEFGSPNVGSRTYFQDLFHLVGDTYRIHRILPNGLAPVDRYHERLEMFSTTNFLAVPRNRPIARAVSQAGPGQLEAPPAPRR